MIKREYWPTERWLFKDPESAGMNRDKLAELEKVIISEYETINNFLIVRKGYIVFEKYFNKYGPDDTHNVASVAKSIISALIGIAIDRGLIESADQKILDFFPSYKTTAGDFQKRTLTIKNLLTMTAPVKWKSGANGIEPLNRLRRQRDWVGFILDLLGNKGEMGKFRYSSTGSHILSAIITKVTGLSAREFANRNLFKPIGMKEIPDSEMSSFSLDDVFGKNVEGWIKDPAGITIGGWGMTVTARDMARFGFLYLNKGNWNGKQIISEKWINESTAGNINNYGYNWWLKGKGEESSFSAAGSGGSFITCIPGKDLVISLTSKITMRPKDRNKLFEDHIIPSVF